MSISGKIPQSIRLIETEKSIFLRWKIDFPSESINNRRYNFIWPQKLSRLPDRPFGHQYKQSQSDNSLDS